MFFCANQKVEYSEGMLSQLGFLETGHGPKERGHHWGEGSISWNIPEVFGGAALCCGGQGTGSSQRPQLGSDPGRDRSVAFPQKPLLPTTVLNS